MLSLLAMFTQLVFPKDTPQAADRATPITFVQVHPVR